MDKKDEIEFFELLIGCGALIHQWGTGDEHEIQEWIVAIADALKRRDQRLREETKKAA